MRSGRLPASVCSNYSKKATPTRKNWIPSSSLGARSSKVSVLTWSHPLVSTQATARSSWLCASKWRRLHSKSSLMDWPVLSQSSALRLRASCSSSFSSASWLVCRQTQGRQARRHLSSWISSSSQSRSLLWLYLRVSLLLSPSHSLSPPHVWSNSTTWSEFSSLARPWVTQPLCALTRPELSRPTS